MRKRLSVLDKTRCVCHCWHCDFIVGRVLHVGGTYTGTNPKKKYVGKKWGNWFWINMFSFWQQLTRKAGGHAGHSAAARNQTVSTTVAPGKKCDSYLVKNARPGLITLAFWLNCNAKNKCVSPRTSQFQRLRNQKKPAGCSTEQWLQFHCEAVNCKHFLLATFWSMA